MSRPCTDGATIEERVAALEAKVQELSTPKKPTMLRFVYPDGKWSPAMEVLDDTASCSYSPSGMREIPLRTVMILLLKRLGFKLDVKLAEPERLSFK
jgi:hypothetical protein